MAGTVKANAVQLGDSATASQNLVIRTNVDGTFTLARGNLGATTQDILTIDANGRIATPQTVIAFSAARTSNQAIAAGADTKVQLTSKEFDPAGFFDNATNYRFQPTVPGYYQFNGQVYISGSALTTVIITLKKAGVDVGSTFATFPSTGDLKLSVSTVTYMNGSTDYVELFGSSSTGNAIVFSSGSRMSGHLIAKA